jgi:2-polyprenyl-6-methoxyphenol hydroxylase-like FAD-dependent oxidoreductase
MEKFDGVVIGAGHNGLTLAAYLARVSSAVFITNIAESDFRHTQVGSSIGVRLD